jgi:hypothetical protein
MTDTSLKLEHDTGSRGYRRLTDVFGIVGPVLQHSSRFFDEVRSGVQLGWKLVALSVTSVVFLTTYGAVLGSGFPLLSLNVAVGVPVLFLGSLLTCIPAVYLLDVLTGSRRSLGQIVIVLLTAQCAAATVFFCFSPIVVVFRLTGPLTRYFVLNVGILGLAITVGLVYMVQGLMRTSIVDNRNDLSRINGRLQLAWMLLFLLVSVQVAQWMLDYYQRTGGFVMALIRLLSR